MGTKMLASLSRTVQCHTFCQYAQLLTFMHKVNNLLPLVGE